MDRKATDSTVTAIGIDIGKNTFHLVGLDERGAIVLRQKLSRGQVSARLANMPPCLVGMEACVGAHHLSRQLLVLGHDVKLLPGQFVKPFLKGQKNDFRDAEAVAEAVQRPTMRFVPTKSVDQLDLQALHRVRWRLVSQRTAIVNQIRAFLLERGIAVRQGLRFLRQSLPDLLANRADVLTPRMVNLIEDLAGDLHHLDQRIDEVTGEIETLARDDEACQRLMTVPGIGPIIAAPWWRPSVMDQPSAAAATSAPGLASCRDRSRPAIEPSSAASPSGGTAIFACSSCRRLGSCCYGRPTGPSTALAGGWRLLPSACITTSWRPLSPTSSPALPGVCCTADAATSPGCVRSSHEEPS
jgi:transposase